jgi:CRISPR-associated protein Cas2
MIEPQAGVFVGNISALVRDKLWESVLDQAPDASAMMFYGSQTEQGSPCDLPATIPEGLEISTV